MSIKTENTFKKIRITDIICQNCGAAVSFDIRKQSYLCAHCGSKVGFTEAKDQEKDRHEKSRRSLNDSIGKYSLASATCNGCGATIVFEEGEALSTCIYCGKTMVRNDYLNAKRVPENIIPFKIMPDEAKELLKHWCDKNKTKTEAKLLIGDIDELKGSYLPYELLNGPLRMHAGRMDSAGRYSLEGYVQGEFIACMNALDDLLLDSTEPFDIEDMREFDFGYVAGQKVRVPDVDKDELKRRIEKGCEEIYRPSLRKLFHTDALKIDTFADRLHRYPVLLPVYYYAKGDLMAAVNGQTGKVAVRSIRQSHFYFLPWYFKAILMTALSCLLVAVGSHVLGMNWNESLFVSALLGIVLLIVMLALYSDTTKNDFSIETDREIFVSGEKTFHRERGSLVEDENVLKRKRLDPVFFEKIDGKYVPVELRFASFGRVLKTVLLTLFALFLPVILALFINGFDLSKIRLGGSAVWFCIFVPVLPVYVVKYAIAELYERPWVYVIDENGKRKRYRTKYPLSIDLKAILKALFIPPVSLAVWFGILSFIVIVYLTAGYGW